MFVVLSWILLLLLHLLIQLLLQQLNLLLNSVIITHHGLEFVFFKILVGIVLQLVCVFLILVDHLDLILDKVLISLSA